METNNKNKFIVVSYALYDVTKGDNGEEKFSKDNRFAFFNSGAIGWTITEENFMKKTRFGIE